MRYHYKHDPKNYGVAMRVYVRSSTKRRIGFHFWMWGVTVIGLAIAIPFWNVSSQFAPWGEIGFLVGCGFLGVGLTMPISRAVQMRRMYKIMNGEINEDSRLFMEVDGAVLISGSEGVREARMQRAAICQVIEGDSLILLFSNKKKFTYIPKDQLPATAIDDLRAWLALPGAPPSC